MDVRATLRALATLGLLGRAAAESICAGSDNPDTNSVKECKYLSPCTVEEGDVPLPPVGYEIECETMPCPPNQDIMFDKIEGTDIGVLLNPSCDNTVEQCMEACEATEGCCGFNFVWNEGQFESTMLGRCVAKACDGRIGTSRFGMVYYQRTAGAVTPPPTMAPSDQPTASPTTEAPTATVTESDDDDDDALQASDDSNDDGSEDVDNGVEAPEEPRYMMFTTRSTKYHDPECTIPYSRSELSQAVAESWEDIDQNYQSVCYLEADGDHMRTQTILDATGWGETGCADLHAYYEDTTACHSREDGQEGEIVHYFQCNEVSSLNSCEEGDSDVPDDSDVPMSMVAGAAGAIVLAVGGGVAMVFLNRRRRALELKLRCSTEETGTDARV